MPRKSSAERVLENDRHNRCFGCGPLNPAGLRLRFHRSGRTVRSEFRARPEWEGWPGRLHSGILYTAMLEAANWGLFGLRGRLGVPVRTGALALSRWVPTGSIVSLTAEVLGEGSARVRVGVRATEGRTLLARLERAYVLPTEQEFIARMGYAEVPDAFKGLFGSD